MGWEIDSDYKRVVVLNISGIYVHIHDQGYFNKDSIEDIEKQYNDKRRWQVISLD